MTRSEIAAGLAALGLPRGACVLLHSSLSSLGQVEGGADAVIDAFLDCLGPQGTLVVPTFGALGVITERLKARPAAVHSIHPLASVAAIGPDAAELTAGHWKADLAHGPDTPYTRIAQRGGHVCLLGVDQDRNTTLHTVEELLRLPYLRTSRTCSFPTPEGHVQRAWDFFPGPHRDFIGLDRMLRESGALRVGVIGQAVVRLIRSQDLIDLCTAVGRRDPAFVLCANPNCADCVAQRAALGRDRLARQPFTVGAAASLAGRYIPEMVDRLHAAGVAMVELDVIRGRPAAAMPKAALLDAVSELRQEGIAVETLRLPAAPDDLGATLELAVAAGLTRLVTPMDERAAEHLRAAAAAGVVLSFVNVAQTSRHVSQRLVDLAAAGLAPRFTLNPAAFARVGERPFLGSYKQKLKRFVDQLDVEDGLFDGVGAPLAEGNGEVKELISILSCASFSGRLILGAGNRQHGDLAACVARLQRLLDPCSR